jgi:hypothetical protein
MKMQEKAEKKIITKIDGAELRDDGYLWCPDCKTRLIYRKVTASAGLAMDSFITIRASCNCDGPIKYEWEFTYLLKRNDLISKIRGAFSEPNLKYDITEVDQYYKIPKEKGKEILKILVESVVK